MAVPLRSQSGPWQPLLHFLLWLTADFYGLPMESILRLALFMHISWNKTEAYQMNLSEPY